MGDVFRRAFKLGLTQLGSVSLLLFSFLLFGSNVIAGTLAAIQGHEVTMKMEDTS